MSNSENEMIKAEASGTVLGTNWAVKVAGTWAPAAILVALVFGLLLWGDQGKEGTKLATALSEILLGVSLGVALMSKRVEDWKLIAAERKTEIDRMASEKNELAALRRRRTSDEKKR